MNFGSISISNCVAISSHHIQFHVVTWVYQYNDPPSKYYSSKNKRERKRKCSHLIFLSVVKGNDVLCL